MEAGSIVRVVRNTASHNYIIGKVYTITRIDGRERAFLKDPVSNTVGTTYAALSDLGIAYPLTRAGMVDFYEREVLLFKQEALKVLQAEFDDIQAKIERYKKYPDTETEVAHLVSEIFKTGGDMDAILSILRATKVLEGKPIF